MYFFTFSIMNNSDFYSGFICFPAAFSCQWSRLYQSPVLHPFLKILYILFLFHSMSNVPDKRCSLIEPLVVSLKSYKNLKFKKLCLHWCIFINILNIFSLC